MMMKMKIGKYLEKERYSSRNGFLCRI
ncbi:hypothetical protein [Photobacterium kishitanii]